MLLVLLHGACALFVSSASSCRAPERALSYEAPRFYPIPPHRVVLETQPGACDLAAPFNAENKSEYCEAFTQARLPQPEPFVAQAVASALAHCPFAPPSTPCRAIDVGGNLGMVTAAMAALGATVDVVEPSADLANAIRQTVAANCWGRRVTVHENGITAEPARDGASAHYGGGWRLSDRAGRGGQSRAHAMRLISLQRLVKGAGRVALCVSSCPLLTLLPSPHPLPSCSCQPLHCHPLPLLYLSSTSHAGPPQAQD